MKLIRSKRIYLVVFCIFCSLSSNGQNLKRIDLSLGLNAYLFPLSEKQYYVVSDPVEDYFPPSFEGSVSFINKNEIGLNISFGNFRRSTSLEENGTGFIQSPSNLKTNYQTKALNFDFGIFKNISLEPSFRFTIGFAAGLLIKKSQKVQYFALNNPNEFSFDLIENQPFSITSNAIMNSSLLIALSKQYRSYSLKLELVAGRLYQSNKTGTEPLLEHNRNIFLKPQLSLGYSFVYKNAKNAR